jgi:hypothetical protein
LFFAVVRVMIAANGLGRADCKSDCIGRETLTLGLVFECCWVLGTTMRISVLGILGLFLVAGATSASAQAIRTAEPLVLAPYESALVLDGSCSAGKVMKVTGAIRGLRRKKMCIPLGETQASLGSLVQ